MAQARHSRQKKRLARVIALLKRVRPATLPVTHRRNRVVLFPDGQQFFSALLAAIRAAKHFVLLEYYLIRDDRTGRALAAELAEAVGRGVRVLLIYDYIGCVDTPSSFFKSLAQRGIELVQFNVPSFRRGVVWFDRRDHRKMTVIDGSLAFLGGCNIGDEYAGVIPRPRRFSDVGFSMAGSAVTELIHIFRETWFMERGHMPLLPPVPAARGSIRCRGQASISIISGGPHLRSSYIRSAFLFSIATASKEILISTPYFVPGPRIMRSLLRASRRGVRVRLLLPARSDVPLVRLLGRSFYSALLRKGIEIYEMEREILHAKVMLIDAERTVIGSANLDQRSFHRNFEINAVIDSRTFGHQISRLFREFIRGSRQIILEDHERRGMVPRILERVVNLFSWFL
ncbi:phosphatidylserine/phosphatidylglycerophosphate/cardiolipin synthase family protein [Geobacter sp. SVR]|uniref:phospholipase D-like domain-containing protein n=1 Tax=Geobacter sp. SVR TaxID=2495594 RepID=UPI00143EFBB6|nr:phospholipase D-like domain-containing protein [Geobacter sp. SVR]BCS56091.1 cardiolipin synthase B [Geobacter sp. SVR]GCF84854.1 cardiolipin synthase B [Geobacter sp. SVR]